MTLRTVVLTSALLLVAGVARAETRIYEVDKNADEIAEALNGVVMAQCSTPTLNGRCSVRLLPTGQIIIEAPPESHTQIAETLKAIAARDVAATPRITLNYWVISGVTGGNGRAATPSGPEPVFAQLRRLHGDLVFSVEESASLTTESGTQARSKAGSLEVVNNVRANGASLRAEISLDYLRDPTPKCAEAGCNPFRQELGLTVTMNYGEYVVLGERAFDEVQVAGGPGTMFYVVHWAEADYSR